MRKVNVYLYDKGGRVKFSVFGDAGLCSDTVVLPMLSAIPEVAIFSNGDRIWSLRSLTDIACGIPYSLLNWIMVGIDFTERNVPVTYPPRWPRLRQPTVVDRICCFLLMGTSPRYALRLVGVQRSNTYRDKIPLELTIPPLSLPLHGGGQKRRVEQVNGQQFLALLPV